MERSHHVKGLTLPELLLTTALVAVLAAVAIPSYVHLNKQRQLEQATETLRSQVQMAKVEAFRRGRDITVFLSHRGGWCTGLTDTALNRGNDCDCDALAVASEQANCTLGNPALIRTMGSERYPHVTVTSNFRDNAVVLKARNRGAGGLSGGLNAGRFNLQVAGEDKGRCVVVSALARVRTCLLDTQGDCIC